MHTQTSVDAKRSEMRKVSRDREELKDIELWRKPSSSIRK